MFLPVLIGCQQAKERSSANWLDADQVKVSSMDSRGIALSWLGDESKQKRTYFVYRTTSSQPKYLLYGKTSQQYFVDKNVIPNQTYLYKVARVPGEGDLEVSGIDSAAAFQGHQSPCLRRDNIQALKVISDISVLQDEVVELYESCGREEIFETISENGADDSEGRMLFASILSLNSAVYGSSSDSMLFPLLQSEHLDCDNYAYLAGHFYELLRGSNYSEEVIFAGFDDGAIGNHAQIIFRSGNRSLLIDPTTGIFANVTIEDLLSGISVAPQNIFSFYPYWDFESQAPSIGAYHWKVNRALVGGLYRPEDQIYYRLRPANQLAL